MAGCATAPASDVGGTTYTGTGERVGGTNVFTARAKLLWEPTDNLRALFTYEMLTDRSRNAGRGQCDPERRRTGGSDSILRLRESRVAGIHGQ